MKNLNKFLDIVISIVMYVLLSFSVITICLMLKNNWMWIIFIATYSGLTAEFIEKLGMITKKKWLTYLILAFALVLISFLSLLIGSPSGGFVPFEF